MKRMMLMMIALAAFALSFTACGTLQLMAWMEWLQPLLYCLLAVALACLLLTRIDLALLCWKEFHPPAPQQATPPIPTAASATKPVRFRFKNDSRAAFLMIKISGFRQRQQAGL